MVTEDQVEAKLDPLFAGSGNWYSLRCFDRKSEPMVALVGYFDAPTMRAIADALEGRE